MGRRIQLFLSNSSMPEKHPEPSRAQECPDTLLRGGCALFSSALVEQTFSVGTEIARLLGLFFPRSRKNGLFSHLTLSLKRRSLLCQLCPETTIPGLGSPSPGFWNSPVHPGDHSHWTVLHTLLGYPQRAAGAWGVLSSSCTMTVASVA